MEVKANSARNKTAKRVMSERKGPINEERYVKSHSINFTANIFRMLRGIAKEKKGRARGKGTVPASKRPSQTSESSPPPKKKKSKMMNQKERNEVLRSLESVDVSVLASEVHVKLEEQLYSEKLREITNKLRDVEQPLEEIITSHRLCFVGLYKECKKGPESFLKFQFRWQKYCSAFLIGSKHSLSEIELHDLVDYRISESRTIWLKFCEESSMLVPVSNPVMMTILSALYMHHCFLDHINHFQ